MYKAYCAALLLAGFIHPLMAQDLKFAWEHEPTKWNARGDTLTEVVPPGTDYWRIPSVGFNLDSGPFRFVDRSGDFEAKVRISGKYHELYHQAGLMIRIDEKHWIKTGIEFVNGKQNISAVVTRDYSDWSVIPRSDSPAFIWMRLQRRGDTVRVDFSEDGKTWTMLRLAYFPPKVPVKIGMVAAAPRKLPFEVQFDNFSVGPLSAPAKEE